MLLPLLLMLAGQTLPPPAANPTPTPKSPEKLPPANPLPPPAGDDAAVLGTVDKLLAGIAARDAAAIGALLRPGGGATVATEKPDGSRSATDMSWPELLAHFQPGPERYQEQISDPAIEVDGDIAMVWAPYVFRIDGRTLHCGVDHFSLIREGGTWKFTRIDWSARTTGCPQ